MAHDPNAIPKLLKRNHHSHTGIELLDENGRHVTRMPDMLRDGSGNTEKYPQGVIRTLTAMTNIADTIIIRYNAGSGSIITKESLMLTQHVGKAANPELGEFELITSMDFSPMIESKKTGKRFRLSWQQILELAIAAGVAQEDDRHDHSAQPLDLPARDRGRASGAHESRADAQRLGAAGPPGTGQSRLRGPGTRLRGHSAVRARHPHSPLGRPAEWPGAPGNSPAAGVCARPP